MIAIAARSAAIGSMLALGACAATPSPEAGRDIVWESERPSEAAPQSTGAGPPGLDADGCREYTQTVRIDGQEHQAFGRACLQPDGSWRIGGPAAASGPGQVAVPVPAYPVPAYYSYAPSVFWGSAFFFNSSHRHKHHGHHHVRHGHSGHRHAVGGRGGASRSAASAARP